MIFDFKNKAEFRKWLEKNHESHFGTDIFIYKKGYEQLGLTYEDAVRTALCYGWIDAVTHAYDDQKFRQYFSPRRRTSSWSISNIIRMKELIDMGLMTKAGLKYFDIKVLDQLDDLLAEADRKRQQPMIVPDYFIEMLDKENKIEAFKALSPAVQKRYIGFIIDAKKEETQLRRCEKIIGILNGDKNNL